MKAEEISKFLDRTGFVFEMRVNELLLDSDYATIISSDFFDLDEQKTREIDIIAWKKINEIHCHLIIECKQSATDKWIFLANKRLPLFIAAIKHRPKLPIEVLEQRFFQDLHFEAVSPLCHNYLAYTIAGNKETSHIAIDECIHKLPKALVDYAAWKEGDAELARLKQERISKAVVRVGSELGIPGLKYGMDLNGYYGGPARLPLLPLTAGQKIEIEQLLSDIRN